MQTNDTARTDLVSEPRMILFSNRLGCLGSVVVSLLASALLFAVCNGGQL